MATSSNRKPTSSELEILHVLWERGPSTVREVHEALSQKRPIGYTSVLKLMQIMTAKGTVRRNEEQRAHVYEAVQPEEKTKRELALDVLQRVFDGSASELMMHALAGRKPSKEEIDEMRRLLNEHERKIDDAPDGMAISGTLRLLALSLLHFLWQGAALAALAYVAMALCRSAAAQLRRWGYNVGSDDCGAGGNFSGVSRARTERRTCSDIPLDANDAAPSSVCLGSRQKNQ